MDVRIGILRKGDKILNAFPYGDCFAIAVQRKGIGVDIVLIKMNGDGVPAIDRRWTICEGDDSVELTRGSTKVTTF